MNNWPLSEERTDRKIVLIDRTVLLLLMAQTGKVKI
jgi:hypothetical protein